MAKNSQQMFDAAPEMYEALLVVKGFFDRLQNSTDVSDPLYELPRRTHALVLAWINSALAKAEGR